MKTLGYARRYVAQIYFSCGSVLLLSSGVAVAQAPTGALVTLATGGLTRGGAESGQKIEPFSRLREGDLIAVDKNAQLRLVYFPNGRQETWAGSGRLVVGAEASRSSGRLEAQVVQLPDILVRQMAKTPGTGAQGRAGMTRLRAIASADQLGKVESTYKQLRSQAAEDDLNPEMYALASFLELRELERVEQMMQDLRSRRPGDPQIGALLGVYERALKDVRNAARNTNTSVAAGAN